MMVNEQVAIDHGLKKDEYVKICELLKRTPNITELGIFSAMWNEHCSYKSSKVHLKKLPTKNNIVIQGPGENAGVIDIGKTKPMTKPAGQASGPYHARASTHGTCRIQNHQPQKHALRRGGTSGQAQAWNAGTRPLQRRK